MAIEGLKTVPKPSEVNLSDQVGASVEALDILDLIEDRDQVTESITAEFRGLSGSGRTGELYVQLPRRVVTLNGLVNTLDSTTYPNDRKYPESFVYRELWTPGFDKNSYKAKELDNLTLGGNGNFAPHARLAVYNPASDQEPLLHFLNKPFDKKYAKKGQQTQLEAIAKAVKEYKAEGHGDFAMTPLNAKAVAFMAITRRIKGEKMPMSTWGCMRDASLPRKTVNDLSIVGEVGSFDGEFYLNRSDGKSYSHIGVGLSVGSKELKSYGKLFFC